MLRLWRVTVLATSVRMPQLLGPVISAGSVCRLTSQLSRLSGPAAVARAAVAKTDFTKVNWRLERDSLWMTL